MVERGEQKKNSLISDNNGVGNGTVFSEVEVELLVGSVTDVSELYLHFDECFLSLQTSEIDSEVTSCAIHQALDGEYINLWLCCSPGPGRGNWYRIAQSTNRL